MRNLRTISVASCLAGFLFVGAISAEVTANPPVLKANESGAQTSAVATSFKVTDRYTAQRRPRVTVFDFNDTNTGAVNTRYGSSVEAMLVTFLKRKSQFVVVERQELDRLLHEKARLQNGMVKIAADNKEAQALLEKIDVFVFGSITLLDVPTSVNTQKGGEKATGAVAAAAANESMETGGYGNEATADEEEKARMEKREAVQGPRIEIDVKLLSRFDGRIIAAAQRSGPVACLRSIVERLGIALEQEFLRPYYGKLAMALNEPDHVRVFLTPILPEDALDEEKPPVELSTTVTIGDDYDIVEPWTTDPTTYTIKNLLTGWYSLRLERPGYEPVAFDNSRWEVRKRLGQEVVYDQKTNLPWDKVPLDDKRFVVHVDPLDTKMLDGNARHFTFRKQGGSFAPVAKREYMDADFSQPPQRVILMGADKIELNQLKRTDEFADDARCDLFDERQPHFSNSDRTYVTEGQPFDFAAFTGGELIIEDYHGEIVPVGEYRVAVWEPSYKIQKFVVNVRAGDEKKQVKASLTRETSSLALEATGPRPANHVVLQGSETRQEIGLPLDFAKPRDLRPIPVDNYRATTDIDGLDGWRRIAAVPAAHVIPPVFDTKSKKNQLDVVEFLHASESEPYVGIKTRFGLAGRLDALSRRPDPVSADVFIDEDFSIILNLLLYGITDRPQEERTDLLQAVAEAGRKAGFPALPNNQAGNAPNTAELLTNSAAQRFPRDPDRLRELLAERLELLDLVVLDPVDMVQLRRFPEVAAIFGRYVAAGGSLFAYVSATGDYRQVIGAPLVIESMSKPTRRLDLAPGEVEGLIPQFNRKEIKVKTKRALPEVADLPAPWHTLAYTRRGRRPRIVERIGTGGGAGYVALWLDDPQSFRGRWGGKRSKVEETRAAIEDRVLQQAQSQMRRRFDRSQQAAQPCAAPATQP
jgi:curli production assembly/transport component CsgG